MIGLYFRAFLSLSLQGLLEVVAGLEFSHFDRRDGYPLVRFLWIDTASGIADAGEEGAETGNRDLAVFLELLDDGVSEGINHLFRLLLVETLDRMIDFVDELSFVHIFMLKLTNSSDLAIRARSGG